MKKRVVVTFSREAGSGGKLIAQKTAQKLGIKFYDEELIDMIAKKTKRRKEIIKKLDEKDRSLIDDFIRQLLDPEYLSEQSFINNMCLVIAALAQKQSCVILGRGANFILPHENCLHVRIVAPYLTRAYYTQKYEKRSRHDAEDRVRKYDFERKTFIREYFGKNPSNTNYYDLVINTKHVSLDSAVKTVVKAARLKLLDN